MAKYKYVELTYEQVEGLREAQFEDFKLVLSDFGGKLRIPQAKADLETGMAKLVSAVGVGDVFGEAAEAAAEDPALLAELAALKEELAQVKAKLKAESEKPKPKPVDKKGFPKGEPHGTFDNSESGYREVWKLGTLDVKWPRSLIERYLQGTTSKPWGYYPNFPKV